MKPFEFQFSPPRGGRRLHGRKWPDPHNFNSRPRAGGDLWTVTICRRCRFQFPPPRGGRRPLFFTSSWTSKFQFPPPRGGRRRRRAEHSWRANFNSRPRAGGDLDPENGVPYSLFQFPPPRGGRLWNLGKIAGDNKFQFPPPRGGRPISVHIRFCGPLFQFPPPRGGRQQKCPNWIGQLYAFMLHSIFQKWQKSRTLLFMPELCA